MEIVKCVEGIQAILNRVNQCLEPQDRLHEEEIARLCADLDNLLSAAAQGPAGQKQAEDQTTVWERIAALWAAFKEELAAWLGSIDLKWRRMVHALMQILRQLEAESDAKALLAAVLVVVILAVVAALTESPPLLVILLAALNFTALVQILDNRPIGAAAP